MPVKISKIYESKKIYNSGYPVLFCFFSTRLVNRLWLPINLMSSNLIKYTTIIKVNISKLLSGDVNNNWERFTQQEIYRGGLWSQVIVGVL